MEEKIPIFAEGAPAIGNQSQAIRSGKWVYVSGQTGCDPATGILAEGFDAQTKQMLANLDAILARAGCSKKDIAIVTLMFSDIKYFKRVDEIYAAWSPTREQIPLPGCNAFESKILPGGAMVRSTPLPQSPGAGLAPIASRPTSLPLGADEGILLKAPIRMPPP